jgi:integrase
MIAKTPNGRWRVRIFQKTVEVATQTFDKKRDAEAWEAEQKRSLILGVWHDPRRGNVRLSKVIEDFNTSRQGAVSAHTFATDEANLRLHIPQALQKRPIGMIEASQMEDIYAELLQTMARATVTRVRDSAVSLFGFARKRNLVTTNVAQEARVPRGSGKVSDKVRPLSAPELTHLVDTVRESHPRYADVIEFLALTGIRWGELAELRVGDLENVHIPAFTVSRSKSDGYEVKVPKSRRSRRVPLVRRALEIANEHRLGKRPNELLFCAPGGGRLNAGNLKRAVKWREAASGHRLHDLRHTAATNWIRLGTDVKTVSVWLGHSSSAVTHKVYAGWLGADSDVAAVERLESAMAAETTAAVAARSKSMS